MANYGYVRVSSKDQNEARQILALRKLSISDERIYIEKKSGKNFERPVYKKMVKKLKPGDVLYIQSIDRFGRNYTEIIDQWKYLTKYKKVDIYVLDMPILDTRVYKDLLGSFVSDLILQILSFVAQNERENIKKRQAEGIAAAKAKGVKFGRRPIELPDNMNEVKQLFLEGKITVNYGADLCGMKRSTFYKYANCE